MKHIMIQTFLLLCAVSMVASASSPQVIKAGIYPMTIKPGDDFTVYAQVDDPDGYGNILAVGLIYDNSLILELPESVDAGIYYQTFTAPENCGAGVFSFSIAAADRDYNASNFVNFAFAIQDKGSDPVVLLQPVQGDSFGCFEAPTFQWEVYPGAVGYTFQIFLPIGIDASINLPADITSVPVPLPVWHLVPEGDYTWRVGAVLSAGAPAEAWSELWTFTKDCSSGPPAEFHGVIMAIEPDTRIISVRVRNADTPDQVSVIPVQVTDETIITREDGTIIEFEDLAVEMRVFVSGETAADPGMPFIAHEIIAYFGPTPPGRIVGEVIAIEPESMMLRILASESGVEVPIQVTDSTEIYGPSGEPLTFSDIVIGDIAAVVGEWSDDILVAQIIRIHHFTPPPPPPVVAGVIVEILPDLMQLVVDPQQWSTDPVVVQVTRETFIHDLNGNQLQFSDLSVGLQIRVIGYIENDLLIAIEIFVDTYQPPPPNELTGVIVEVIPDLTQITVSTHDGFMVTVQITSDTAIIDELGNPMTFNDLAPRQLVHVIGEYNPDGLLSAIEIVVFDFSPPPPPGQISGVIIRILPDIRQLVINTSDSFVGEVMVQVTENTIIMDLMGQILNFNDLTVGLELSAVGTWDGDLFIADLITVFNGTPPPPPNEFYGLIQEIDPNAMQLVIVTRSESMLITVQVTDQTVIFDIFGNVLTFDDLQLEQFVKVVGVYEEDLFIAHEITIFESQPPPPVEEIWGVIIEIDPSTYQFTVLPFNQIEPAVVQVTEETSITDLAGNELTFDSLALGSVVQVQGIFEDAIFIARQIVIQTHQPPQPVEILGVIVRINPTSSQFVVSTANGELFRILVTDATVIVDPDGNPLEFADLAVGQTVEVVGEWDGEVLVALTITVHSDQTPPQPGQVHGAIIVIDSSTSSFTVEEMWGFPAAQVAVQVTDATLIMDIMGNQLSFEDLIVGAIVMVSGIWQEDILMAQTVTVFAH